MLFKPKGHLTMNHLTIISNKYFVYQYLPAYWSICLWLEIQFYGAHTCWTAAHLCTCERGQYVSQKAKYVHFEICAPHLEQRLMLVLGAPTNKRANMMKSIICTSYFSATFLLLFCQSHGLPKSEIPLINYFFGPINLYYGN